MPPPMTHPAEAGHIWMVTGPAGCGKTTVATHLAQSLGIPYLEGDDYHPKTNVDKMSAGHPLNDADRWDWLIVLRRQALQSLIAHAKQEPLPEPTKHLSDNPSEPPAPPGVIVTCSALKVKYRDVIRLASYYSANVHVHFVYLKASEDTLVKRVESRQGHWMKASMVHSQFADLEEPTAEEWDCITVDVSQTQAEVMEQALRDVKYALEQHVGKHHGTR